MAAALEPIVTWCFGWSVFVVVVVVGGGRKVWSTTQLVDQSSQQKSIGEKRGLSEQVWAEKAGLRRLLKEADAE